MEGAAFVMLRYSSPIQQCSTSIGRSLFEWYCGFEDLFCILAAYESRLPPQWRFENVRIRAIIAEVEYKYLAPSERKPRMLDDVWGHMYASGPQLRKIIAGTTELKKLHGQVKRDRAAELEAQLREVDEKFTKFLASPLALEVLETAEYQSQFYGYQHSTCCPFFPLEPLAFQFPPAGIFKIAALCLQTYLRAVLHPSLCAEMDRDQQRTGLEGESAEEMAIELCRAFAGLESALPNLPEIIIPCQAPMMIAGLACPPSLRIWVFCKLLHLDRFGQPLTDVVRRNLAVQWKMPEIENLQPQSLFQKNATHSERGPVDIVGISESTDGAVLVDDSDGTEDSNLEPLTQHRGIFLMGAEQEEQHVEVQENVVRRTFYSL